MELNIHITEADPSHSTVVMTNGTVKKSKYVHVKKVVEILNSNMNMFSKKVRTGPMPRGFVDSSFDYETLSGKVAVYVPAAVRRMNFNGEIAMIPFPNLILVYEFTSGAHHQTVAFAVKESNIEKIKGTTTLYNYPFGNVSPGTGNVCWGSNRHEELVRIADVNIFTDKFLNSLTNRDWYQIGISNASKKDLPEFLSTLKEQVEKDKDVVFNPDYLVPTTFTLDSIMIGKGI